MKVFKYAAAILAGLTLAAFVAMFVLAYMAVVEPGSNGRLTDAAWLTSALVFVLGFGAFVAAMVAWGDA